MGFSYNVSVLNQKGSPAIYTDTFANRPSFGYAGRLFIANDTSAIYEDTGTSWVLIANVSSGAGTLQQVTTNGNTSNVGISITAGGLSTNSLTDTALTLGSVLFSGAAGLVTQDNAAFFWDDTNNRLGINTNTPGNSLDVHSAGTNPILALNNTAGNQSAISFLNTAVAKWRIGNAATTNTFDIFNFGLSANAIKINNGDNSIEITNNINVQSNGSILGSNANGSDPVRIQANNVQKVIRFYNSAAGTADLYVAGSSTTSAFYFSTFSTANALRIENSGAVLVNNPSDDGVNKLQVNGSAAFSSRLNGVVGGVLYNTAGLWLQGSNSTDGIAIGGTGGSKKTIDTYGGALALNGTAGNAVLINSLVDDTVNKLQVSGSGIADSFKLSSTRTTAILNIDVNLNLPKIGIDIKTLQSAAGGAFIQFTNLSNASCGSITHTTATTVTYNTLSDYRLKQDFKDFNGINLINSIKVYDFEWIEDKKRMYGVIAHEIQEIIPYAVTGKKDGEKMQGLDYSFLTPILTKAIQDQQKIIESLIKRIELLENK